MFTSICWVCVLSVRWVEFLCLWGLGGSLAGGEMMGMAGRDVVLNK